MIPKHYSDWIHYFDMIYEEKEDINSVIEVLQQGSLDWTPGVSGKIVNETFKLIEFRLKKITQLFQKELNQAYGSEHNIISAIMNARASFNNVKRLCNLNIFPSDVVEAFNKTVNEYIVASQENLMKIAKDDKTGLLSSIFKHNQLISSTLSENVNTEKNDTEQPQTINKKQGRRVLF